MPSYLLRQDRDTERYIGWSDVVEAPVFYGDRAAAVAWLRQQVKCPEPCCDNEFIWDRLRRADDTGTSAIPGFYAYDDDGLIAEQRGYLLRECLWDYAVHYAEFGEPDMALLQPFEDSFREAFGTDPAWITERLAAS